MAQIPNLKGNTKWWHETQMQIAQELPSGSVQFFVQRLPYLQQLTDSCSMFGFE
jgi:hypothetical protein